MSKEDGNGNGVQSTASELVDTLVLTYNRATDNLQIGGHANSLDLMLDILARATRQVEFQLRKAQALQIQAEARQAAEDARIAAALRTQR